MDNHESYAVFKRDVIRSGRILLCIAMFCALIPGIYLLTTGVEMPFSLFWQAFKPMLIAWFVVWCIEPISYYPVLGLSGSFISWLSGNILNLRIPCSVLAQQVAEVEEGTEKGDVISTIGLCVSVFVNLIVVFVFALVGTQILAAMPEHLKEAFNYMVPTIMGSMMVVFAVRDLKMAAIAFILTFACRWIGVSPSIELLFIVFPTIFIALLLYKFSKKNQEA